MRNGTWRRIGELVHKELIHTLRNPRLRSMVLLAPLFQLMLFGYAVSTDVRHAPIFLVDHDRTQASRELVEALTGSGYFRVAARSDRSSDLVAALDRGRALMGVEIPVGFARARASGAGATVQLLFDGTNSNMATVARGYAERILVRYAVAAAPSLPAGGIDLRERAWYNPDLKSRNYNVPGVAATVTFMICLVLTSLAVVRERELGTLEQLMVSPLRPGEMIAGKTIPFMLIALFDLVMVTTLALVWFHVPLRGSALLLFGASLPYLFAAVGLGLLISTISATQREAYLTTFLLFMPTMLLSGFMFPVSGMPTFFRWITLANPLRHYLEIVRGVFLKGAGLSALWPQCLALVLIGTGVLAFAATRFHKTVR
jgi:ABC-2 type transport system permease protein